MLRGRLRESEQLHRHHGLPLPLQIRHDEFAVDILENQILRTACERMLTVPRVDAESQRMLRRLLRDFTEVTSLSRGDPIPAWQPTRLNARYHAALRLAEIVLGATSVEHQPGGVLLNGFLLDMPQLFEDFVTVALREALTEEFGGRVDAQDRHYLDQAAKVTLRPDMVWKIRGSPIAVVDAKYKSDRRGPGPRHPPGPAGPGLPGPPQRGLRQRDGSPARAPPRARTGPAPDRHHIRHLAGSPHRPRRRRPGLRCRSRLHPRVAPGPRRVTRSLLNPGAANTVSTAGVWTHAGAAAGALMLSGGLLHTAAALSYHRHRPDLYPAVFGYHEVFHTCVCAAAACQYAAIAVFITNRG